MDMKPPDVNPTSVLYRLTTQNVVNLISHEHWHSGGLSVSKIHFGYRETDIMSERP